MYMQVYVLLVCVNKTLRQIVYIEIIKTNESKYMYIENNNTRLYAWNSAMYYWK